MKRALTGLAAVLLAQGLMVALWYAVEGAGAPEAPAPELELRRADGSPLRLSETRGRPMLVHFWATWCPPCREEMPALLAYAARTGTGMLAVSLDPEWAPVRGFFGSDPPASVVLAGAAEVEAAFAVRTLPVTLVLEADGRLRERVDGARDWARLR